MNKIEFIKDKIPFTQVANGVLTSKKLSAKAKGLYAYLYSKPDGWDFAVERICLEMSDGKASINEGLRELEKHGFLTRKRQSDGRVVYLVHFPPLEPNTENRQEGNKPFAEKATVGKSHNGKIGTVSNKDSLSNKDKHSNKEGSSSYKKKPYYKLDGTQARFSGGKWWSLPKDGSEWLHIFRGERDIIYK